MFRLLKLIFLIAVGLIAYNYFYGTEEEKARSEKVIDDVKDVVVSLKELAVAEKEKFDEGKYDKALKEISILFEDLKDKSAQVGDDLKERLKNLEEEKVELEKNIEKKKKEGVWTEEEKEQTREDFKKLIEKTETLFKETKNN